MTPQQTQDAKTVHLYGGAQDGSEITTGTETITLQHRTGRYTRSTQASAFYGKETWIHESIPVQQQGWCNAD